jgi:uncharacterized protein (TIGR03086 family)
MSTTGAGATGAPLDDLARATAATGAVIAGIGDEQWDRATPCREWTARQLLDHLVTGNLAFAAAFTGGTPGEAGGDPQTAYRLSTEALRDAMERPGAMEQTVTVPFGTVPAVVALHLRVTELLVHGWDLAQATGQAATFPDDLAEQELAFSRRALGDVPPDRSPFAPPQPVAADAPAIDRLAACLGRPVTPDRG